MSQESLTSPKRPMAKETKVHKMTKTTRDIKPRKEATDSMEYTGIILPTMENGAGPVALGDLWNCRTSTIEGNLFDGPLTEAHLQADPIQTLDYTFRHVKNTEDAMNTMKISASLKLDLTGGVPLTITGSGSYASDDNSNFREETVIVTRESLTYQVRVRPSASKIISEQVKQLLIDEKIVATHFVQAVICGGKATGSMKYSEKVSDSKMDIKGEFKLTGKFGPLTVEAEASFAMLDSEKKESYDTAVEVHAQPKFGKSPVTVEEMLEQVKQIDTLTEQERHFPQLNKKDPDNPSYIMRVSGVPLWFKLVPISHILIIDVDPLFKLLEEDLMNEYSSMLFTLRDYSNPQYIKIRLLEMQPSIVPILMDDFNPLTKTIREYSTAKAELAVKLKMKAASVYMEYKTSKGEKTDELWTMLFEYNTEFNTISTEQDLLEFKEEAKKQLAAIRASDVDGIVDEDGEPSIRFFSNSTDLADWYNTERKIKVLLKTDYTNGSPTGVFLKLYDMSPTLAKYGVEVGVAYPNISDDEFSLTYKTQYETTVYESKDIRFALEVLAISVDEGETISKLFYSINAALSGLNLPMHEYLFDVPNLVIVMREYKDVVISETYCDLLARLTESVDTYNFVFPIQALNTGVEMMRFFRQLRVYIPERYPGVKHRFLVSRFNNVSDKFYSPLLLVFKDNLFKAVCLDQLDILIMMEQLPKEEPDWDLISFGRIRESCIYTPRADWAISVVQNLILDQQTSYTDPIADLPEFPDNTDKYLPWAIEVTRASAQRIEPEVLTTVAHLALINEETADELEALLATHGWKDNAFTPGVWKTIEWGEFSKDLKNFVNGQAPFLLKVVLALDELKNMPLGPPKKEEVLSEPIRESASLAISDIAHEKKALTISILADEEYSDEELNEKIDKVISFLLKPDSLRTGIPVVYRWRGILVDEDIRYEELRKKVEAYNGMMAKIRRIGIIKLFDKFVAEESASDEMIHIFHLLFLVEGMADPAFKSLKHVLLPMCRRYCAKVQIADDEYPRGSRRIADSLTERQLFKTLGVLSEIKFNPKLYVIHQELFNYSILPAPVNVKTTIEKMTKFELDDDQLETIWTNPKFLYALRQVATNEGVLETIAIHLYYWTDRTYMARIANVEEEQMLMQDDEYLEQLDTIGEKALGDSEIEYPTWIPPDIVEKVKALIALRQRPNYPYPKEWDTVELMIEALQIIVTRLVMPIDFMEVLLNNVNEVEVIKEELQSIESLHFWNVDEKLFDLPWSLDTVITTLDILKAKYPDEDLTKRLPIKDRKLITLEVSKTDESSTKAETSIIVNSNWKRLVRSGVLSTVPYQMFHQLDSLNPIALTEYDQMQKSAPTTLRYIIQQLKMNNGTACFAQFFEKYINYPPFGPRPGMIDFGDGLPTRNLGFFLSRGDIQTALFHLTDPIGTHYSLTSMAKTPIPLPFLITSIEQHPGPKSTLEPPTHSILLAPALRDIIVPEMEPLVKQPRLFRDPYRFVLTLRVGDTGDEMGRSSLINSHLMKVPTFFSSKNDPGSAFGRPLNRNGFLEFSWLSESTCDPVFWTNFVKPEYDGQRKEIILLGLLHGDALSLPSLFEVIRPYVSCFVVFWKVLNFNDLKAKKKALTSIIGTKKKVLDVVLYPDPTIIEKVHDQNLIFKQVVGGSQHIVNKAKLQNISSDAIAFTVSHDDEIPESGDIIGASSNANSIFSSITSGLAGAPKGSKPLSTIAPIQIRPVKPMSTPESIELLKFIEHNSIGNLQDAIRLQDEDTMDMVLALVDQFSNILKLSVEKRDMALLHLTWELDFLSRKSSQEWKDRIYKLRAQIDEKFLEEEYPNEKWALETQQEMRMSMEKFRRNTMTIQDLWRLMWEYTEKKSILEVGLDFIKSGYPIEMFHPTYTQDHLWGNGVREMLAKIPAETRILVISTFGLKASGKSTLLNSLFGLGFTEQATTFGLQMRILWLNEELKASLDCDAFILIDSEGVGGAENKIDENADMIERKLVTLLLGISSVSLPVVLGPHLNELKDILEVSMSSLSKLDLVLLTPDVYLVQQYLPGMTNGGSAPSQFSNSLQSAVKLTTDLELQVGLRVTEAHRLKQIKSRNKHGEVVHTIRSRGSMVKEENPEYLDHHEDIQNLYSKIIHVAATTRGTRMIFGDWFTATEKLWEEIHQIGFPFKCSSTSLVREAVQFDDSIDTVKKAIDAAFFYHEKKAEAEFKKNVDNCFDGPYDAGFDGALELELNKLIGALQKVINACDDLAVPTTKSARRRMKLRLAKAAEPNPDSCTACAEGFILRESLFATVLKEKRGFLVEEEVNRYTQTVRDSIYERLRQGVIARQISTQKSNHAGDLRKHLDAIQEEFTDEEEQWSKFMQCVSTLQFVIPARHRFHADLKEVYKNLPHIAKTHSPHFEGGHPLPELKKMRTFDVQIYNSALESAMNAKKPEFMNWLQHDWLVTRLTDISKQMKDDFESVLYRPGMARDLQQRINKIVLLFEEYCGEHLLPNFKWEVHAYAIQLFSDFIEQQQNNWDLVIREEDKEEEEGEFYADKGPKVQGGNPLKVLRNMRDKFTAEGGFFLEPDVKYI